MTSSHVGYGTVTCTPHCKPDAENPWVTKETKELIHYWFNPGKIQTLLEVAETIEAWATREYEEEAKQAKASMNAVPCSCCIVIKDNEFHATITKMEIRGVSYNREEMAHKYARDCLHDAEPVTLKAEARGGMTVQPCCTIL